MYVWCVTVASCCLWWLMDEYVHLSLIFPLLIVVNLCCHLGVCLAFLFASSLLSLLCCCIWFYLLYLAAGLFVFIAGVFYIGNFYAVHFYMCKLHLYVGLMHVLNFQLENT